MSRRAFAPRRGPAPAEGAPARRGGPGWAWLAAAEVVVAAVAVLLDVLLPTLVVLALAGISLAVRREGFATLGFHRLAHPRRQVLQILGLTAAWTVLQLALFMPVVEHVSGQKQDITQFGDLQGNGGLLLVLLALSWTLAAVGEELAYRGYIHTRITDATGGGTVGVVIAVVVTSALFGLAHTEQGVVGVALTFLDALFFSALRLRCGTLWASVLAHGFNNTIGLVAFFLAGPFYGLW